MNLYGEYLYKSSYESLSKYVSELLCNPPFSFLSFYPERLSATKIIIPRSIHRPQIIESTEVLLSPAFPEEAASKSQNP